MSWLRAPVGLVVAGCAAQVPAAQVLPSSSAPPDVPEFSIIAIRRGMPCDHVALSASTRVADVCGFQLDARTGDLVDVTDDALAVLSDGSRLVGGSHGGLEVVRGTSSQRSARQISTATVEQLAVSPAGDRIAYIEQTFTPSFREELVVRETTRWSELFAVPYPIGATDSFERVVGFMASGAVLVPVGAPSCAGRAACSEAVVATVSIQGIDVHPNAAAIAARKLAFAPDGSALALATDHDIQVVDGSLRPVATLSLAAERLAPDLVWALAVAPRGDTLAVRMFDVHGVVVFVRRGATYRRAGEFRDLHPNRLAFDRSGELLIVTGDAVTLIRKGARSI